MDLSMWLDSHKGLQFSIRFITQILCLMTIPNILVKGSEGQDFSYDGALFRGGVFVFLEREKEDVVGAKYFLAPYFFFRNIVRVKKFFGRTLIGNRSPRINTAT